MLAPIFEMYVRSALSELKESQPETMMLAAAPFSKQAKHNVAFIVLGKF